MQSLLHDPRVVIAHALSFAAPIVGWLAAIRITRVHHTARLRLRRRHQWVVVAYYLVLTIAILIERTWPPALGSSRWQVFAALTAVLFGAGFGVGYSIFSRARKIVRSDFSSACPGCGYLLQGLACKHCPECGHAICHVSDRAS